MVTPPAWSYSSIKLFETCPRKYESERVTKEVPFTDSTATIYGKELHLAAEEFIRDGKPLESRFSFLLPTLDKLKSLAGEHHCELKMGLKNESGRLVSCDFFDPEVVVRGVADLVVVSGTKARVIDYKTSKSAKYADTRQLALMAACVFAKFPEVESVKAALLFVVSNEIKEAAYTRSEGFEIFATLHGLLKQRETAYATGVFNPKPNGLCRNYCSTKCIHNGRDL